MPRHATAAEGAEGAVGRRGTWKQGDMMTRKQTRGKSKESALALAFLWPSVFFALRAPTAQILIETCIFLLFAVKGGSGPLHMKELVYLRFLLSKFYSRNAYVVL